jgi:hypothetical protein
VTIFDAGGEELEQQQRWLIGGVEVIKDEKQWLSERSLPQKRRDAVEEPESGAFRIIGCRRRQVGEVIAQLWKDLCDVRSAAPERPPKRVLVAAKHVCADALHPRPVSWRAAGLPAAANQHLEPVFASEVDELFRESALSDTGFAADEKEGTAARAGIVQRAVEFAYLTRSPDERRDRAVSEPLFGVGTLATVSIQRWVMVQYQALKILQGFAGLEAESFGQYTADLLVGLQRFGLTVRAVEREHELRA